MGTTWYDADTSGIRWGRAAVPGTGGVLPVEVTHLGSVPPWSAWMLRRTAFEAGRVEDWFVRHLAHADGGLLANVVDDEFAHVTAVAGGTVVARLVVEEANAADLAVLRRAMAEADGDDMPASDFVLHLFPLVGLPAEQGPR